MILSSKKGAGFLLQVFNYLATRRDSVHDLVTFVKGVVKTGNPHKSWPTIAQLPGDYTPPGSGDKGNVNLIAYQVRAKKNYCHFL